MRMRIFTLVWGSYIDWFEQALVKSLRWPRNLAALREYASEWNLYCRQNEIDRLRAIAEPLGVPLQFHPFDVKNSPGETLQPCLLDHMRNCLQSNTAMFIAPPDTIFGEGSVEAIAKLGSNHGVCIAVPHVRVNAGALGEIGNEPVSNAQLVGFAFKNLHPTWRDANADLGNTNSYLGGVSWRSIAPDLFSVTHRLPTCYLANIDATDLEWFSRQYETGVWDHSAPERWVKAQRHRTVGSSDAAFIVELTKENENIPPLRASDPLCPDLFWRDLEHNFVNRNVVAIFRGE